MVRALHGICVTGALACLVCGTTSVEADTPLSSAAQVASGRNLYAVAARDGRVIAVGDAGVVLRYRRKSGIWARDSSVPTSVAIRAISHVGKQTTWTAGVGGQTMQFDRGGWSAQPGGTGRSFYGIAMVARDVGVIVGGGGRIYARAGKRWDRVRLKLSGLQTLRSVAAIGRGSRAQFIAVGDGGTALWLSGAEQFAKARKEHTGVHTALLAVAACPGRRGEIVAAGVAAVARDGRGRWRRLPTPPKPMRGIALRCRRGRVHEIVAVGAGVWRLGARDSAWRLLTTAARSGLNGVAWLGPHRVVVVGDAGFRAIVDTRKRVDAP